MPVMGNLLAGQAPLRGRASLELLVRPFGYRREFVAFDAPAGRDDFEAWLLRSVLNPQSPLFREARYLLAEETEIRDPALYHSVLAAIADGNRTNGAIASFVGRKSADITHPLNVLEDAALVAREADLFRRGRWLYRVNEPLITFYEVVMRPEWYRLETGHAESVWRDQEPDFLSRVVGPHFEWLCRSFAMQAGSGLFGSPVGEVGSGIVNDPANRTQIEIDVAVLAPPEPGHPRRLLSLGESNGARS
jgi:hypothetical protein